MAEKQLGVFFIRIPIAIVPSPLGQRGREDETKIIDIWINSPAHEFWSKRVFRLGVDER